MPGKLRSSATADGDRQDVWTGPSRLSGATEPLRGPRIRHSSARPPRYPPGLNVCLWFRAVRSVLARLGGHPVTPGERHSAEKVFGIDLDAAAGEEPLQPVGGGSVVRSHQEFTSAARYKIPS